MMKQGVMKEIPAYLQESHLVRVCITDLEGRFVYVNKCFSNRFAYITEDFLGKPFEISVAQQDLAKCHAVVSKCIQAPDQIFEVDLRKPKADGLGHIWIKWEFSLLQIDNQPAGIRCIGQDITTERKQEVQLQYISTDLTAIKNSTRDFNIILTPQLCIRTFSKAANDAANQFFRKNLKVGESIMPYIAKEDRIGFVEHFQKALSGKDMVYEKRINIKGKKVWFEFALLPIFDDQQQVLCVAFNAHMIDSVKRAKEKINQQSSILQQIAYTQSHLVRGPLANILGCVQLLEEESNISTTLAERRQLIQYIAEAAKNLDEVIWDIVQQTDS